MMNRKESLVDCKDSIYESIYIKQILFFYAHGLYNIRESV